MTDDPLLVLYTNKWGVASDIYFCVPIINYQSNHQGGTCHVGAGWCVLYVH